MNGVPVSNFLLERYHIGEVTPEEKRRVEEALSANEKLAITLKNLEHSDNDFFQRFPKDKIFNPTLQSDNIKNLRFRRRFKISPVILGFCAAALVLAAALPMLFRFSALNDNYSQAEYFDRMKGASGSGEFIDLNIFLKGQTAGEIINLPDKAGISEGNTIQLAYYVPAAGQNGKYGVIFSIDGNSYVTMHYPYSQWQSTQLVSGRAVPLDEAFTLDDAPHYEIFFFVAGDSPINIRSILDTARQLALQIEGRANDAEQLAAAAFNDFEVKVFTLIKE